MNALPRLEEQLDIEAAVLPGDQSGKRGEAEGKNLLVDRADHFFERLKAATNINFNESFTFDLSAETRYEKALSGKYEEYFAEICAAIKNGAVGLKAPTETSTVAQVQARLARMKESGNYPNLDFSEQNVASVMHLLRQSPNDVLRNGINAVAIVREHEPVESLYTPPKLADHLEIRTFGTADFYQQNEQEEFVRTFNEAEAKNYAEYLVEKSIKSGKPIAILTKATISPLDQKFASIVEEAVIAYNTSNGKGSDLTTRELQLQGQVKCRRELSDSAMAKIVAGGLGDCIIASLPDNASRLNAINAINRSEINQDPEAAEAVLPMSVFRVATGFGYGGKLSQNGDLVSETYVMDPKAVTECAKLASQEALKRSVPLTVALPDNSSEDSPLNEKYKEMVLSAITCNATFVLNSKMYADLVTDPTTPHYQVVMSGNACGDHITDIVPALQCGKLGQGVLGIGESRIVSVEENDDKSVRVKNWIMEASAGTAPTLEAAGENYKILPAGFLLAICRFLAESPDLDDQVHEIGIELHDRIYTILNANPDRKDWTSLVDKIFAEDLDHDSTLTT